MWQLSHAVSHEDANASSGIAATRDVSGPHHPSFDGRRKRRARSIYLTVTDRAPRV